MRFASTSGWDFSHSMALKILQGDLYQLARQSFDPEVGKRQRCEALRSKRLCTAFTKPASHPAESYHRRVWSGCGRAEQRADQILFFDLTLVSARLLHG